MILEGFWRRIRQQISAMGIKDIDGEEKKKRYRPSGARAIYHYVRVRNFEVQVQNHAYKWVEVGPLQQYLLSVYLTASVPLLCGPSRVGRC